MLFNNLDIPNLFGGFMEVTCALVHPNGFFVYSDQPNDFWVLLSKEIGWGRFSCPRPDNEGFNAEWLFVLREIRPVDGQVPAPIIESSDVLWRRREAIEAEKSICSYLRSWQ